ncbi:hypothetical protein [Acidovorax sp. SUPP2539]|uniref:hypothetical protein n=1 Tax=Acidovorax sp. SUPP2539 TaxID=2920878 RepID=UPI0024E16AED|nr:hypothetical protein [Acidovorax sp. SUPP2539]
MAMDQIAIAIMGAAAAWLSQSRDPAQARWACIFGMLGQPFWFYAAWKASQWGIFVVCVLYAIAWMRGLWVHWLSPRRATGVGTIQITPGRER